MTANRIPSGSVSPQEQCIDLPGEAVSCWRSSDNLRIILRKHRDVFFEVNLKLGATYTVEAVSDFYSPLAKKLVRKVDFKDGERLHLWVGRGFKGDLILKQGATIIGSFTVSVLDTEEYGSDPKIKPEPLMVLLGSREMPNSVLRQPDDPYEVLRMRSFFNPQYDPKVAILGDYGTRYEYSCTKGDPEIGDYVCVTEAVGSDLQDQVRGRLDDGSAVEGGISQIFIAPTIDQKPSGLYAALAATISNISGNEYLTSNWFKESAGYLQENWRSLDKIFMRVRVEKKAKGKYRVILRGRPLSKIAAQAIGSGAQAKRVYQSAPMGAGKNAFLDGGFARDGKSGYGGMKRMILTSSENFRGGMKIQIIGTVIDIIGDVNDVYFKEEGSKDLSEFLGRAGVSIMKAGATAVMGSIIAALMVAGAAVFFTAGVPVVLGMMLVVGGYILAATIVDKIDSHFGIKEAVAERAR